MAMTAPETPALDAANLYRFFHAGDEEILALRGVTLTVEAGELVAVMGPSGSGKSTLLACLAGLDEPDGGSVRIGGERMTRRSETERGAVRARTLGVVFQSVNLVAHLDVDDNVRAAQLLAGKPDTAARGALFERLGLSARRRAFPAQLSGGENVRAGLAVALANNPVVVLADEPTAEVDGATEQRILSLLQEQATGEGRAVVVATHSDAVAARATRVVELWDGVLT
jgi:putative ABC transport system ATP-binding protein